MVVKGLTELIKTGSYQMTETLKTKLIFIFCPMSAANTLSDTIKLLLIHSFQTLAEFGTFFWDYIVNI